MNVEEVREYCITKKGAEEAFPFNEGTLVFKVMGKMFALLPLDKGNIINLKCDPERAIILREENEYIIPGFHMNKKHWNTVDYNSNISRNQFTDLIDHSYDLIVSSLTKKLKEELKLL